MVLTSAAFGIGGPIPRAHTCDGAGQSPPLRWGGLPDGTAELVVTAVEVPAGCTRWIVYGVPPTARALPAGLAHDPSPPSLPGAHQGMGDGQRIGYDPPCPPPGESIGYRFTLRALSAASGLPPGASAAVVEKSVEGLVLETCSIEGRYRRTG